MAGGFLSLHDITKCWGWTASWLLSAPAGSLAPHLALWLFLFEPSLINWCQSVRCFPEFYERSRNYCT